MRAFTCTKYGPPEVLEIVEMPKPTPGPKEILIRNHATTVSAGDGRIRSLKVPTGMGLLTRLLFGLTGPRQPVLGTEFSGVVEAVGKDVVQYGIGDSVIGYPGAKFGAYAEYVVMPENGNLTHKPENMSFEEAAALCFGGATAYDFLINKAGFKSGERVLVNGASGATGTACVQLAKHFGGTVTAVCSAANSDLLTSIGADRVIDYKNNDFVDDPQTYDLVIDTVETAPWSRARHVLANKGRLVIIAGSVTDMIFGNLRARMSGKQVIAGVASETREIVQVMADLAAEGHYVPVIDRTYSFDQMIDAHRYVDKGHKKGNVVILVDK